jgi:hypothetical protein
MRHRFLTWPSTRDGRRAGWLGLGVVGLFLMTSAMAGAGAYEWSRGARIALLGIPAGLAMLASIGALVFAIRALRQGERSIALVLPLLLGAFAVLFVVGEFAFPH